MDYSEDLRDLLERAQHGDDSARTRLFEIAYQDLRIQARAQLRRNARSTLLDTTALVHESFLRFLNAGRLTTTERGQFFAYAARVMRSVVVDFARRRFADRRGGSAPHVPFTTHLAERVAASESDVLRIDDAMKELQQLEPRLVQVVEMRYFAGMSEAEISDALGIAVRTVRRDWEKAKLLLGAMLR